MLRKLRRIIGHWIAGTEPAHVHCSHCGHIITAWCREHREQIPVQPR